jgi:PPOX class probable FMN-dependent enzyme
VVQKEVRRLDGHVRNFISLSPLVLIGTANRDGQGDVSPRGGAAGFTLVLDDHRLVLPEVPGNRRADTLLNVIENPNVGLLYLVPGMSITLRVNGRAVVIRDPEVLSQISEQPGGKPPVLGIGVEVEGAFFHCPRSFDRGGVWTPESWSANSFPPLGEVIRDQIAGTC